VAVWVVVVGGAIVPDSTVTMNSESLTARPSVGALTLVLLQERLMIVYDRAATLGAITATFTRWAREWTKIACPPGNALVAALVAQVST
jgi:hypothetical protein